MFEWEQSKHMKYELRNKKSYTVCYCYTVVVAVEVGKLFVWLVFLPSLHIRCFWTLFLSLVSCSLSHSRTCIIWFYVTCTSCLAMFVLISTQYEIFDSKNGLSDWLKFGNIMLESAFGIAKTKHTHRHPPWFWWVSNWLIIFSHHTFVHLHFTHTLSLALVWICFILLSSMKFWWHAQERASARARAHAHTEQTISTNIYGKKICESNTKPPYTCHSVYIETYYIYDEFSAHCLFRLGYATYSHRWSSMLIKIHNSEW